MSADPAFAPHTGPITTAFARGFLDVTRVNVPLNIAVTVHEFLKDRGSYGLEAVAFWAGVQNGENFDVMASVIPDQDAEANEIGLAVVIGGEALFSMNVMLHTNRWSLIAQIHSHPGRAYHSETDNAYSVVSRIGGLSIVIPHFASGLLDPSSWSVHRLDENGRWQVLKAPVGSLIHLVE